MSTFKCKMCGGTLEIQNGSTVVECEYCGANQTLPKLDDEKRANLYDRANHFRRSNEFDKASAIYEQILTEDNTDAEAYWSLVLCRYGIEYVEDPLSHRRVPTVHRAQYTSIFDDDNYKSALKNADTYQRVIYEEEAKAINEIQKGILAISQKEDPFDVFICYKETDDSGKRTHDSVLAQDLYYQLKQEGFKVFFARITLEDKLGSAYEPYIFAALNSAKVMVVLGTKPEYFNAVWVKNEWSRFLSLIKNGEKKMLIPAYRDMDPYNLPKEFSHLQAQDMSKLGFMQDLLRGIKKILGRDKKPAAPVAERVIVQSEGHAQDAAPLLRRAFIFLEDGEFDDADEYAEKVLDINPECAEAYVVKLLVELKLKKPSDLAGCKAPFANSNNYQKAIRFASPEYRETIEGYNNAVIKRIDTARKDEVYARGVELMKLRRYDEAIQYFQKISTYKDSTQKIDDCKKQKETDRLDGIYERAKQFLETRQFDRAATLFESIKDYKDAKEKIQLCAERKETARKDAIYAQALQKVSSHYATDVQFKQSIKELQTISGYRDVDDQIRSLNVLLEKWCENKKKAEEEARIKAEEERRTRERLAELRRIKAEKTKKAVKKATKISILSVIALTVLYVLIFCWIIPLVRYNTADDLLNAGKYDEAMEIYKDIGGFSESENRITLLTGINNIDSAKFETGIKNILSSGAPVCITYGMNGGDFGTQNVTDTVSYNYHPSDAFNALHKPEKRGYRFVNWELETYSYQIDGTFEMKLNAVWSENEYTIEYDLNGGVVTTPNPVEYGVEDESFTLVNPTKKGYTFTGWIGTDLNECTMSVTIENGSVGNRSYIALWEANTYTLTFDANGGTVNLTSVTVTYNQDYTVPTPTREGYTFRGWKFNGEEYKGGKWQVTSNVTVVADWVSYTLTTNTNNANAGTFTQKENTNTTEGDTITLTATTNAGYTFNGWYEGTKKVSSNLSYTFKMPSRNVILTAKWTANSYTITYDDLAETRANVIVTFNYNYSGSTSSTVTLTNGQTLSYPTVPTRSGYAFAGWYTNSSCTTAYNFSGTITSDITLYAKWVSMVSSSSSSSREYVDIKNYNSSSSKKTFSVTASYSSSPNYYYFTCYKSGSYTIYSAYTTGDFYITVYNATQGSYIINGYNLYSSNSSKSASFTANAGDVIYVSLYKYSSSGSTGTGTFYVSGAAYPTSTATASCSTVTSYVYDASSTVSTTVTFGASHTLPTLTRTGYSFLGWYNGETKVESGDWSIASNVTLTPRWQAGGNTITLDVNGGTVSTSSVAVTYNQEYTLPTPTRAGYTFGGWYNGTTKVESGIWAGLSDITLTASWTVNNYTITFDDVVELDTTATITYNYNYSESTSSTVTLTNGETLTYPTVPTRSGYAFAGWYTNSSCTTQYDFSGTITEDITLYAKWVSMVSSSSASSRDYVDIKNHNTSSSAKSYTVTSASSSSKPNYYYFTCYKSGSYTFSANRTSGDYYITVYNATQGTTIMSKYNLYGSYSSNSATFSANAGDVIYVSLYNYSSGSSSAGTFYVSGAAYPTSTATASLPESVPESGIKYENNSTYIDNVDYGTNYTLPTPTRSGYTFGGWYNGTTKVESGTWNIASDVTLTAKWTANTYTITFDANGGSVSPTSQTVTYDSTYTLPAPTWPGHAFYGWYNGNTKVTDDTWTISSNATLTAHWDAVPYFISYTLDGGTNPNPTSYTVNDSFTLQAPTKTGYTFLGWTYSGQTTPKKNVTIATGTTGDLSYTAHWQKSTYTVTFDANGGSVYPYSMSVTYDESYTLPTPTRTGYTFAGWYNGSTKYTGGIWNTADHTTLTASWTANSGIAYVVNHYKQNIAGSGYEDPEVQDCTGTADATITPAVKSYTGFTSPSTQTVTVAPDGTLVVNYYYTRNSYTITMVTNGGETITEITQKYQSTVTLPHGTRAGYTFGGWFINPNLTTSFELTTMPASDTTVYAWWTEENKPNDFTYSGTSEITITGYTGTNTIVVVPSYIGGNLVVTIADSAFANNTTITKVTVPNTVTFIGEGVFAGCTALEELVLPFIGSGEYTGITYTVQNSSSYPWSTNSSGELISSNHGSNSLSEYTITAIRNTTLLFEYKTSSESGCDRLTILKNGTQLVTTSGITEYVQYSVQLNAGDVLVFRYSKDGSVNSGSDCAFIRISQSGSVYPIHTLLYLNLVCSRENAKHSMKLLHLLSKLNR